MKFIVSDRLTMERGLLVREPYIIISIRDSHRKKAKIRRPGHCRGILYMRFDDTEPTSMLNLPPGIHPMSDEDAVAIWQFFQEHQSYIQTVVVHCEQGMSRSPAVAAALAEATGQDARSFWRDYLPNPYCHRAVVRASRNCQKEVEKVRCDQASSRVDAQISGSSQTRSRKDSTFPSGERSMTDEPTAKVVQAAAEHLRSVILNDRAIRQVVGRMFRDLDSENNPRVDAGKGTVVMDGLPDTLMEMLRKPEWEKQCDAMINGTVEAGSLITRLVSPAENATKTTQPWREVVRLLKLVDCSGWPKSTSSPSKDIMRLSDLLENIYVRFWVRHLIIQNNQMKLPVGPSTEQTLTALRQAVKDIEWEEEGEQLRSSLADTLDALRTTCTDEFSLKTNGQQSWMATVTFLGVWFPQKGIDSQLSPRHKFTLDLFWNKWLPELVKSRSRIPDTGTKDINWELIADPDDRVHKQESTRKPGSRRDNRGHN